MERQREDRQVQTEMEIKWHGEGNEREMDEKIESNMMSGENTRKEKQNKLNK